MTAFSLIDQLHLQGVRHFCIAPGSRSTPLVLAALAIQAKVHVHFDERGLGFFALGMAKALREPIAVIVTSGTAVGNLLPAVMEAHHSCTPLILLTADRPIELRDCGANQSTDQIKIFSSFVRYQIDLTQSHATRSIAAHSWFMACHNPPGPVHINCPFREKLYQPVERTNGNILPIQFPRLTAKHSTRASKGLILVGRLPEENDIHSVLALAKRLQWPVFCDVLSGGRGLSSLELVRETDTHTPDFILHFGERLTVQKTTSAHHVTPYPFLQDPDRNLASRVQSHIPEFCEHFTAQSDPNWLPLWKKTPEYSDHFFANLHLPEGFSVFLGNGLSVREADRYFYPSNPCSIFSNRGLSGIDGNIATIAGLAEKTPVFAVIGDQTALYDLNSLPLIKKAPNPVVLMIVNNFGGGIFRTLPVAEHPDSEKFWQAAHDIRFEKIAEMFQIPYTKSITWNTSIIEHFPSSFSMAF